VYEVALCNELRLRGIIVDRQISMPVQYKGEVLDCYMKLDLLVEKSVIVEVKSVERLIPGSQSTTLDLLETQQCMAWPADQLQR
jgi:GxxExxY protein